MRFSSKALSSAFALSIVLLWFPSISSADAKEDVAAAALAWAQALGEDDPDKVLPLYSDDAVLWGTLSPTLRADRAALRDYFVAAFKALPELKVSFGDHLIRVYGGTAINTGYYTFSYVKEGQNKQLPARYSFAYVKSGERWLIVDHHSSAMPSVPK
ncbi:MAG TPA: SgcJ/EcaC family oxidoreductase [Casimicrobiaceae bacterium]